MALRIGIYALAKNEIQNVPRWEDSCREADVRVVTDTGSTDGTQLELEHRGVEVRRATISPWRWDDAHNAAMQGLPANLDLAIRLDLDEALAPGWREALEEIWTPGTTRARCRYEWAPGQVIWCDRIHGRQGFRWRVATHEWLHAWDGSPQLEKDLDRLLFIQRRAEGKKHGHDLSLLETAVAEAPGDARARWYLAREYGFAGKPLEEQAACWDSYLALPGGNPHERAFALRQLASLRPSDARRYLVLAALESPAEPEAYLRLAYDAQEKADPAGALYWARFACQAPPQAENHASEHAAYGAMPMEVAVQAAILLGRLEEARQFCRLGLSRRPDHPQLLEILADLETPTTGPRV